MQTQRFEFQGLEVPVETWGSSSEALVFLPGLGVHPRYYRPGLERLSSRVRIVVPDLSFRTHRNLPTDPLAYHALVRQIAAEMAPGAIWAGHSFGGLLALMNDGPAIACAPSVPARVGLVRMAGRAVRQQTREYLGLEGWDGAKYAGSILTDYLKMVATAPRVIFPSVLSLDATPDDYPIQTSRAVVYLPRRDQIYRPTELEAYLGADREAFAIETVEDCHDWPVTNPEGFEQRIGSALEQLRG